MNTSNLNSESDVEEYKNLCVICGIDIGSTNPRQYCYKTYCPTQLTFDSDELQFELEGIYTHSYNTRQNSKKNNKTSKKYKKHT